MSVSLESPAFSRNGMSRTTLGDLVAAGEGLIQTGPFGSQLHAHDYVDDGVPVVMPQQLGDNVIDTDGIARIRDEDRDRLSRHIMREGDIVFSRRGDVTRRAYITAEQEGWLCGTGCLLVRLTHPDCDNRYLVRFLGLHQSRSYLVQHAVGATMPNLNQGILASVPVALPTRREQERIVEVTSAYDDLIENNRRRIQLLEQAARLLYKEWFVHLRFPGHEHVKVLDGVPEGWERRVLGECAKFLSGKTPSKSKSEFWGDDHPWISSGELTSMRLHRSTLGVTEDALEAGSRLVPPGTILAVVRGMSLAKEWRIGVVGRPATFNQDIKGIVANEDIEPMYLFHALDAQRDAVRDRAGDASHGTKKLDTPVLSSIPVLVPSATIQFAFRDFVRPLHSQWDKCDSAIIALTRARDLLLPRLMNGEIAV